MMDPQQFAPFVIIVVVACIYLLWVQQKQGKEVALAEARKIALQFMLLAEKKYGTDKGVLKMDFVTKMFYAVIPAQARFIITEQGVSIFLEAVYRESKDYLDDGVVNDSVR